MWSELLPTGRRRVSTNKRGPSSAGLLWRSLRRFHLLLPCCLCCWNQTGFFSLSYSHPSTQRGSSRVSVSEPQSRQKPPLNAAAETRGASTGTDARRRPRCCTPSAAEGRWGSRGQPPAVRAICEGRAAASGPLACGGDGFLTGARASTD